MQTEILPLDLPAGHRGTTPITVDLNTCQNPSWSLTYALIFYWPFRSDQHKTLIKRHVTTSGATARWAAHSFSLIMPFFHFCIRYCVLSILACLLCLNRRSQGRYRWRSRLIGSGLYSPMRLFCGRRIFRSLHGTLILTLILCWYSSAVWLCFWTHLRLNSQRCLKGMSWYRISYGATGLKSPWGGRLFWTKTRKRFYAFLGPENTLLKTGFKMQDLWKQ